MTSLNQHRSFFIVSSNNGAIRLTVAGTLVIHVGVVEMQSRSKLNETSGLLGTVTVAAGVGCS